MKSSRPSLRHLGWAVSFGLVQTGVAWMLSGILPGFDVHEYDDALVAGVSMSLALALAWPLLYAMSTRVHPLLFPVLSFALAGTIVFAVAIVADSTAGFGVDVAGIGTGAAVAGGLAIGTVVFGGLFSLGDRGAYYWFVIRPLVRKYAATPRSSEPGMLFLEIDGLSEPVLRKALDEGWMPTLKRWVDSGSHRVTTWEPDLSSQTSASQAGILLGDNADIPAFSWYEKSTQRLMVSSSIETAREIEKRIGDTDGLLQSGGASRWNFFSGGAPDCLCTVATFGDRQRTISGDYLAHFINPYTLPRLLAMYLAEIVRERWEAWQQRRADIRPRISRTFAYALRRPTATVTMQETTLFMLISDMLRGIPSVYTTLLAYDKVAHFAGIDRRDAMKTLQRIDRALETLEQVQQYAARPYQFVVLSDHGQSSGPTFRAQHGTTLQDLVASYTHQKVRTADHAESERDTEHLNPTVRQAIQEGTGSRTIAFLQNMIRWGTQASWLHEHRRNQPEPEPAEDEVVVQGSGNLGVIYFPRISGRATTDQIEARYPGLLGALISHAGIGFVMVRTPNSDTVVEGRTGSLNLTTTTQNGANPLAHYGDHALHHLKRTDGFSNAPDILVMSVLDPHTGDVQPFEERAGSHGGLGGNQTKPVLVYPQHLPTQQQPVIGAAALHHMLKTWLQPDMSAPVSPGKLVRRRESTRVAVPAE